MVYTLHLIDILYVLSFSSLLKIRLFVEKKKKKPKSLVEFFHILYVASCMLMVSFNMFS